MYLGLGERRQGGRRGCSGNKDQSGCTWPGRASARRSARLLWTYGQVGMYLCRNDKEVGEAALDIRTSQVYLGLVSVGKEVGESVLDIRISRGWPGPRRQGGRRGCSGCKDQSGCTWAWESVDKEEGEAALEVGEAALNIRTSRDVLGPGRTSARRSARML
jgi:hypothetical protein